MATTDKYYNRLKELQEQYPELTFDNNGYEYLSKAVQEKYSEQINEISSILKETFDSFVKFNNFKPRKDGTVDIRLQYKWSSSFEGVGYFAIDLWRNYDEKI